MAKTFVGKNRAETLDWLLNRWLKEGPPVCFLQGFPGVGKSDLARDFRALAEKEGKRHKPVINEIADRLTPSVFESLMELSVVLSNQGLPEMEKILFDESNPNLAFAMEKALQRPVLIILDEAQRFFQPDSGTPLPEMSGILSFLRNRQTLRGRLLLLSDRVVEQARWSEWIPIRTLTKLAPDEAVQALEIKIKEAGIDTEISAERQKEVVRDLDFNPRAIEALVGALQYENLDEIIESNPGLWAVQDREVSREFLAALERDLLERTMGHLDASYLQKLRWLAVHRRSFKRQALERLCKSNDEATRLKNVLVVRFLANFYRGDFSINPIVREISLAHLRDDSTEFRQAHSKAADYHLRHFKAKQIVAEQSKLGESFAELRYHLTQAGRQAELSEIGHRFTNHLKQQIKSVTPVPTDREELDERIGVLKVLLENGGSKALEFHLARCLQNRGRPGDLQEALKHADRATGSGAPEESWYLLAKLTLQAEGIEPAVVVIHRGLHSLRKSAPLYQLGAEILVSGQRTAEAVALLKDGIKVIPPENLFSLYQNCAELLAKAGKIDEAVALLKDGIKVIPPEYNLVSLYQNCAELLAKAGKIDEAVALLKDGIKIIPTEYNLVSLYQIGAELLAKAGKIDEAVALLKDGIKVIPPEYNLVSLYQNCAELLAKAGKIDEAVALLKDGIKVIPPEYNLVSLYQNCAELLAKAGKIDEAVALLKDGIKIIPTEYNLVSLYQIGAELLAKAGKIDEAVALLKDGIKVIPPEYNLFWLYQMLGKVFCRAGNPASAIASLREGLQRIPDPFGRYKLAEGALYFCAATGNSLMLKEIASTFASAVPLGSVLLNQMQGEWRKAAHAANGFRQEAPHYLDLANMEAFSLLAAGESEDARRALLSFPNLRFETGGSEAWLAALIQLRCGALSEASSALAQYLGRPVDERKELNERFLLRLWDEQESNPRERRVCYHFPIMPPSLTGMSASVHRVPFSKPVLPTGMVSISSGPSLATGLRPETLEVYVSYAWGEDSTPEGKRREEIVDRLCEAVRASGREIGRDKERMRGGDSIERFAHEISRAARIIAIISEKSLHSDFCMAHELFRAYRRCDYRRDEFQEKVIALVMDDARPFLKDELTLVALAEHWKEKFEKLHKSLLSIDPNRRNHDLWVFVDLMEEMISRLPGMLAALKDIVMKRGFDSIVADQFREVLDRLPPR